MGALAPRESWESHADKLAAAKVRKAKGESVTAIAKAFNVSRATLYRALADAE
ncbi:helix-turn-helix domain-containing protein [Streptomyces sp. NPDC005708]|uniref:helix-turn-helix domain-containing protein n=1 Tax=Streptomyces sp. NPDC005708 TaxID=3154564 RepID=UPI0033D68684